MTEMDYIIQCPDDRCCGVLIENIIGAPQCNECQKYFVMTQMSDSEVAHMLHVIDKSHRRRERR